MADSRAFPWGRLAAVAGGVMTVTLVGRGLSAVAAIAREEASYRAGDPNSLLKWLR